VGTPLLALVVDDVKTAVPLLIVPNLVMDGFQLQRQGPIGDAPRRLVPLLIFTIVGTIIGTKLLVMLSARAATLILGSFVLGFVALDLARVTPRIPRGFERRLAPPVGLVAGVMGGITNSPGTVLALYFVALGMDKREFVRSIALTFLVVKGVQLLTLAWYGLFGSHPRARDTRAHGCQPRRLLARPTAPGQPGSVHVQPGGAGVPGDPRGVAGGAGALTRAPQGWAPLRSEKIRRISSS
jgi:Sulfite exporter TauE/SafE